jgi:undecaprenyl-diphosphatase
MESTVLAWIAAHRAPWLDVVMRALTEVGRAGAIWLVAAFARGVFTRRAAAGPAEQSSSGSRTPGGAMMAAFQVVLAVAVSWLATEVVLKPLVARPRPYVASVALSDIAMERPSGYSFPSGHATTAAAGAYALSAMWPGGRMACALLAALITCSRAYLGAHYPSDLLAGALLGWFIGWVVVGRTRWRAVLPAR